MFYGFSKDFAQLRQFSSGTQRKNSSRNGGDNSSIEKKQITEPYQIPCKIEEMTIRLQYLKIEIFKYPYV